MQISNDQWTQLRRAAFDDDRKRFEAMVEQLVRQRIHEHNETRQADTPFLLDGRPYLCCNR